MQEFSLQNPESFHVVSVFQNFTLCDSMFCSIYLYLCVSHLPTYMVKQLVYETIAYHADWYYLIVFRCFPLPTLPVSVCSFVS